MTNQKTNNDMKKIIVSVCLLLAATAINAQKTCKDGGISATMLQEIVKAQPSSTAEKALANAIAQNKIDDLAKNYRNASGMTTKFNVETPSQSIHDQKSSGRCWMFSGLNVLRANFAAAHDQKQVVDFSQAYLFFYDQLEKANLMLQGSIDNASKPIDDERVQFFFKNPINDGGTFCGVADLAEKYGLVPMQAMPETYNSDNTSRMARIISSKLREYGLELRGMVAAKKKDAAIKQRKTEMLGTIYHILALTLGEPTKEFSYTFRDSKGNAVGEAKTYTPKSFYDATVGSKLNGTFIMVMNDPRRPYHKTYEVDYDRHVYDGHNWKYLNLPMDEIAQLAIASLKDGHKMYSSYDGQAARPQARIHGPRQLRLRHALRHHVPDEQGRPHSHVRQRLHTRHDTHGREPRRQRKANGMEGGELMGRVVRTGRMPHNVEQMVQRVHVPPRGEQEIRACQAAGRV